jgi:hypothetical protein
MVLQVARIRRKVLMSGMAQCKQWLPAAVE